MVDPTAFRPTEIDGWRPPPDAVRVGLRWAVVSDVPVPCHAVRVDPTGRARLVRHCICPSLPSRRFWSNGRIRGQSAAVARQCRRNAASRWPIRRVRSHLARVVEKADRHTSAAITVVNRVTPFGTLRRLRPSSSMAEQLTLNQLVQGSSPWGATTISSATMRFQPKRGAFD
jgi:hypothetical protein